MKLTKNQFQFVVNCDVEAMVAYLQADPNLPLLDAFDKVFNSRTYEKLIDVENGLYSQRLYL